MSRERVRAEAVRDAADPAAVAEVERCVRAYVGGDESIIVGLWSLTVMLAEYDRRGAIEARYVQQVNRVLPRVPGSDPDDPTEDFDERVIAELERLHADLASAQARVTELEGRASEDAAPWEMDEAERLALPAEHHKPMFVGVSTPQTWCCAVCWGEGWTTAWPCDVVKTGEGAVQVAKALGVEWSS